MTSAAEEYAFNVVVMATGEDAMVLGFWGTVLPMAQVEWLSDDWLCAICASVTTQGPGGGASQSGWGGGGGSIGWGKGGTKGIRAGELGGHGSVVGRRGHPFWEDMV